MKRKGANTETDARGGARKRSLLMWSKKGLN